MKNALKLTVGSVLALGVTVANADFLDRTALKLGLQYGESSTHWDAVTNSAVNNNNFANHYHQADSDLGYLVGLSHRLMSDDDARVFVDFERFDADDDNKSFFETGAVAPNFTAEIASLGADQSLTASLDDEETLVRLGYNRTMNMAPSFDLVMDGFLAYGKVERDYRENFADATPAAADADNISSASFNTNDEFSGFGPGVGFTGKIYPMGDANRCLNLYVGGGATLLYGDTEHNASLFVADADDPTATLTVTSTQTKSDRVVPKLDAKVGLGYDMRLSSDMKVNWDLGVKWVQYSNVVGYESSSSIPANTVATGNTVTTVSSNHDWSRWSVGLTVTLGGAHS